MGHVGEGGEEEAARIARLPGEVEEARVLEDDAVRGNPAGQPGEEPPGRAALAGLDEGVHGHIDAGPGLVGQVGEAAKLARAEILRLHARGKVLEPHIDGVGAGGERRQEGGRVARGREDLGPRVSPGRGFGRGDRRGGRVRFAHAP